MNKSKFTEIGTQGFLDLRLQPPKTRSEIAVLLDTIDMGTEEWCKKEINCIKGCATYCLYCYAKAIAIRFKRATEESWRYMTINDSIVGKNFAKVKLSSDIFHDVMFPTSHNIVPDEPYFSACVSVLKSLLCSGNTVLITLKPYLTVVKRLCSLLADYREQITFRFSIGSTQNAILTLLETNAPPFEERCMALDYATKQGFNTSVSIEPLLDDTPDKLVSILEPKLSPLDIKRDRGTMWIGVLKLKYLPLKLRTGQIASFVEHIRPKLRFSHIYSYYERFYEHPAVRWKESIVKPMLINNIRVKGITA